MEAARPADTSVLPTPVFAPHIMYAARLSSSARKASSQLPGLSEGLCVPELEEVPSEVKNLLTGRLRTRVWRVGSWVCWLAVHLEVELPVPPLIHDLAHAMHVMTCFVPGTTMTSAGPRLNPPCAPSYSQLGPHLLSRLSILRQGQWKRHNSSFTSAAEATAPLL